MAEFTIGKGMFVRSLWESKILAGKGFADFKDGNLLCFMMLLSRTRMHVVGLDLSKPTLTDMIEAQTKPPSPIDLVIPGMFQDTARSESALLGHVYTGVGGLIKGNKTRDTRGYLTYMEALRSFAAMNFGWSIAIGDTAIGTALSEFDAGFTGLIPMIHTPDPTKPATTFESDEFFQAAVPNSGGVGRTIVAYNVTSGLLLAVVQPEGFFGRFGGSGFTLTALLRKLVAAGADEAVGLDGSTSVFVHFRKAFLLPLSANDKNHRNITATGFSFVP